MSSTNKLKKMFSLRSHRSSATLVEHNPPTYTPGYTQPTNKDYVAFNGSTTTVTTLGTVQENGGGGYGAVPTGPPLRPVPLVAQMGIPPVPMPLPTQNLVGMGAPVPPRQPPPAIPQQQQFQQQQQYQPYYQQQQQQPQKPAPKPETSKPRFFGGGHKSTPSNGANSKTPDPGKPFHSGTAAPGASSETAHVSVADVRRCKKLLRRMYELRIAAWAMRGAHISDEPKRLECIRKADLILFDIRSMVDGWQRMGPNPQWTEEEYQEVVWIAQTLADPNWQFGVGVPGMKAGATMGGPGVGLW